MKVIMMNRLGPRLCWFIDDVDRLLCDRSAVCVCFRITRRRHDAEHHQLPVADLRPAGSGSHGQRLPRQTQGRNQQNRSLTGRWAGDWAGQNNTGRLESIQEPQDRLVMNVKIQNFGTDVTK